MAPHIKSCLEFLPQATVERLQRQSEGDDRKAAELLLAELDVDADGELDLYEFLAYLLDRRKTPVPREGDRATAATGTCLEDRWCDCVESCCSLRCCQRKSCARGRAFQGRGHLILVLKSKIQVIF